MIDNSIDDKLKKIKERLEKLVNDDFSKEDSVKTNPEEITSEFGLSLSQAKAWLKKEPDFPSDVSYHEPQNRRRVNGTEKSYSLNMKSYKNKCKM
jgi:hypothetical protein